MISSSSNGVVAPLSGIVMVSVLTLVLSVVVMVLLHPPFGIGVVSVPTFVYQ